MHSKGPPGGTANVGRDAVAVDDLRARASTFSDGLRDIARQRVNIIRRHGPFISMNADDIYWFDVYGDPEEIMRLERYTNHKATRVRQQAAEILQDEDWQHLNRIEQNIRPMRDDLAEQITKKSTENIHNQQMAVGEGKPMAGGSTIPERGLAAEIRELHPLVNSGDRGVGSRVGQFNLLLNQVVHDKTTAPFDREGMKLIRAVARNDKFEDLGRAPSVPSEALMSNDENNRRVQALIPTIKSLQKASRVAPGAVSAPAAPAVGESVSDENQPPRLPLHMMRGQMWEEGQNRRYF